MRIVLNGKPAEVPNITAAVSELAWWAGLPPGKDYTVFYTQGDRSGVLVDGASLLLTEGVHIRVEETIAKPDEEESIITEGIAWKNPQGHYLVVHDEVRHVPYKRYEFTQNIHEATVSGRVPHKERIELELTPVKVEVTRIVREL